jgi:hypothetical protein
MRFKPISGAVDASGGLVFRFSDGKLLLDHHDARFGSGKVGLWTKADSVSAFDDLVIRGVPTRGS